MKMDGENQCHWDERFIKVTLSSKLLKPLYLISVVGILTYQHNLFTAEAGAERIYQLVEQWQVGQLAVRNTANDYVDYQLLSWCFFYLAD